MKHEKEGPSNVWFSLTSVWSELMKQLGFWANCLAHLIFTNEIWEERTFKCLAQSGICLIRINETVETFQPIVSPTSSSPMKRKKNEAPNAFLTIYGRLLLCQRTMILLWFLASGSTTCFQVFLVPTCSTACFHKHDFQYNLCYLDV